MRIHHRGLPIAATQGFSLIEVLVALGIFAVVTIGMLGVMGATAAGGFQDASPVALATGRRAKDLTVAGVYLQGLHDHLAALDDAAWTAVFAAWPPGVTEQTYCIPRDGAGCAGEPALPAALGAYPMPESAAYQLDWTAARVLVQHWFWDCTLKRYAPGRAIPTGDLLIRVRSTILWRFNGVTRTLAPEGQGIDRFLTSGSLGPLPSGEVCP